jgi:hypothetical protein
MAIALSDLVKDLDRKGVVDDFIQLGKVLGLSTSGWQPGEPIYALVVIFADQITKLWNNVLVRAIRAVFLDYAEGDWLTLFAGTFYETWRQQETFAVGDLAIENRGFSFYNFSPGDIKVANATNKSFASVTGGVLGPWDGTSGYPTLTLSMQADEVGSASNTTINGIAVFPTTPLSAYAGIYVVSNTALLGSDEETDSALKARARLATGPLSPASPVASYESMALSTRVTAAGVPVTPRDEGYDTAQAVNVNRVRVLQPGGGVVNVYLASTGGAATGNIFTAGTDVFYVNAVIQDKVVPAGITANVASAVENHVTLGTVSVYVDRASLVTSAEAYAAVQIAITEYFETLPIGGLKVVSGGQGYVFLDEVKAKASESNPGIFKVSISGSDIALQPYEVAVPNSLTILPIIVTQ